MTLAGASHKNNDNGTTQSMYTSVDVNYAILSTGSMSIARGKMSSGKSSETHSIAESVPHSRSWDSGTADRVVSGNQTRNRVFWQLGIDGNPRKVHDERVAAIAQMVRIESATTVVTPSVAQSPPDLANTDGCCEPF